MIFRQTNKTKPCTLLPSVVANGAVAMVCQKKKMECEKLSIVNYRLSITEIFGKISETILYMSLYTCCTCTSLKLDLLITTIYGE
jgi:hypothetical protein